MSLSPPSSWSSISAAAGSGVAGTASTALSPPLLIVQLFLDRLSSPWESHFNCTTPVQIRFVPLSSTPSANLSALADGHVRVGQGRLFIVRRDQIGWLQLDIAASKEEEMGGGWRGRIKLIVEEEKKQGEEGPATSSQAIASGAMCRKMECELRSIGHDGTAAAGLITLTAHLLISVDELGWRRRRTNGKKREGGDQIRQRKQGIGVEDAWAQTEENPRNSWQHEEIGVQTGVVDHGAAEKQREGQTVLGDEAAEKQSGGQRLRRAASARMMMLIMMALMRRRGGRDEEEMSGRDGRERMIGRNPLIEGLIKKRGGMLGPDLLIERMMRRNGRDAMTGSGRDGVIGRDGRVIGGSGREEKKTREMQTMTHVSIDPRANAKIGLHPNQIALLGNYRARIGYLSAVHRSMVPKEGKRERVAGRGRKSDGKRENVVARERQRDRGFLIDKNELIAKREEQNYQKEEGIIMEKSMKNNGVKWTEDQRGGGENSSGLQSIASSESGETSINEMEKNERIAEGMRGREIAEWMTGRGRQILQGMNGREITQGINGRGMKIAEMMNGRGREIIKRVNGRGREILQKMSGRGKEIIEEMTERGRERLEETNQRVKVPEGMIGRGTNPEEVNGREKEKPEETRGRIIRAISDRMNETIDGREEGPMPDRKNEGNSDERPNSSSTGNASPSSAPSSSSGAKKSSTTASSSSSSSSLSSAKRSSSSAPTSATVTSSSTVATSSKTSTKSSSDHRQQKNKSSKASSASSSSSTLKGSSAKTDSSIATEMSKNGRKSASSERQSSGGSSVPTERKLSDQSKESQSPTSAYLIKLRKQVLDDL
ncbi:hypothetical protein niasHT_000690 [Heterodera trifolii]|uniref:Uncharacterized protein n=1 Tax=Heterodera trifolii TaxID=157864 RepID=A0ABD2MCM4_9BILA